MDVYIKANEAERELYTQLDEKAKHATSEEKDKLKTQQAINNNEEEVKTVKIENKNVEEAESALQVLGYNKREIEKAFEKIDIHNLGLEEIIKQGLKQLGKN